MPTIQEQINTAICNKYTDARIRYVLKLFKSEFQRERDKVVSDERAINILTKYMKNEKEMLEHAYTEETINGHLFVINIIEQYLPEQVSVDDVKKWIIANITLSDYKNKMQAMRPIMQHFGTAVNGNVVKDILNSL